MVTHWGTLRVTTLHYQTPGYTQRDQDSLSDIGLTSEWPGCIRHWVTLRVTRLHYRTPDYTQYPSCMIRHVLLFRVTRLRYWTPESTQFPGFISDSRLNSELPGSIVRHPVTLRVTRLLYQTPGHAHWTCFIIKYLAALSDQTSLSSTGILSMTRFRYETLDYTQSDQRSLSDTGSHLERPVCIMGHWTTLRVNSLHFRH
jgi:hypothetical protein